MCLGTLPRASAPVELTMRFSSMSIPGSPAGTDPVAMMIWPASITSTPPSVSATETPFLASSRPVPRTYATLFFLNSPSMPLVKVPTTLSFSPIITLRSSDSLPVLMPWAAKWLAASS